VLPPPISIYSKGVGFSESVTTTKQLHASKWNTSGHIQRLAAEARVEELEHVYVLEEVNYGSGEFPVPTLMPGSNYYCS
jgi:hypothetical protein